MSQVSYFTADGLKKLQEELTHLKTHERLSISKQIAEARERGDKSENAEYEAAKDAQGMLELKISKLEEVLSNARLLDKSKIDNKKISVLSTVKIKDIKNGKMMTYTLVSENEADIKKGKISVSSPIGKSLLGKSLGDTVDVKAPSGIMQFKIREISR